jgi:hypothetical protein
MDEGNGLGDVERPVLSGDGGVESCGGDTEEGSCWLCLQRRPYGD